MLRQELAQLLGKIPPRAAHTMALIAAASHQNHGLLGTSLVLDLA